MQRTFGTLALSALFLTFVVTTANAQQRFQNNDCDTRDNHLQPTNHNQDSHWNRFGDHGESFNRNEDRSANQRRNAPDFDLRQDRDQANNLDRNQGSGFLSNQPNNPSRNNEQAFNQQRPTFNGQQVSTQRLHANPPHRFMPN